MKSLRIATLQGKWFETTAATNAWYVSEAQKLKNSGIDILVLPELYHTPYFPIEEGEKGFDWAIEKNDTLVHEWQEIAKELNAVVVFPFFEKRARGIYYNSAYVFERDGSIAGLYRKSHIPDDPGFYEKYYFAPGDTGFEPIQTSAGKIGVLICWDQWFPEAARINALKGADVLIYPTAIGWDSKEPESLYERQKDSWMTVMRGHAIANRLFVVAANRIGTEDDLTFWGHSFVSAPDGYLIEDLKSDFLGTSITEIDLSEIEFNRRWWPHFRDRRTDLYKDILKTWDTP
ncbi:MAG: carbon-nitrogen hydrolase [Fibrobacter sp.]|nr:carbon-nitrogen hydrolase [Fibrobacter sp.]